MYRVCGEDRARVAFFQSAAVKTLLVWRGLPVIRDDETDIRSGASSCEPAQRMGGAGTE
jgi:hypothetical protein